MKSNNPFKVHGIEHLSQSKINLWINDPALFIGTYLCGMKGSYGCLLYTSPSPRD